MSYGFLIYSDRFTSFRTFKKKKSFHTNKGIFNDDDVDPMPRTTPVRKI